MQLQGMLIIKKATDPKYFFFWVHLKIYLIHENNNFQSYR